MTQKLLGKRAVITGGSRGIGKAIAQAFLAEGAEVLAVARNGAYALDVSDASAVERFAQALKDEGKPLDVLVNAAGIYGPIGSLDAVEPALWLEALKVNLYGTFLMMHYLVPLMRKNNRGVIINFVGGGEGAKQNFTSYVSSKGGVARLTETAAAELKRANIMVNAVAPGAVNTKLLEDVLAAGPEFAGASIYEESLKQKASGGTPPQIAAALAVWLASDASRGLTGKILSAVWDEYEQFPERMADIMATDVYTMRRVRPKK